MSQYTEVRKKLAEQNRLAKKQLPPRKPPPESFKEAMERIRDELEAKKRGENETEG